MDQQNTKDILQLCTLENLFDLKNVLKSNWPSSIYVYYFIDTSIQLEKTHPNQNYIKIYSPNGDISDGTFIAIIDMYCYDVLIYTLDKNMTRLEQSLKETKIIDWDKNPLFCAVDENFYEMAFRVRNEIGHPFPTHVPSNVWWLPKEKALNYEFSIPEDLYIAPLNESHIFIMNAVWPHRSPGSEKYLAKVLELNGGIGLFAKTNDELCAWVLKNYFGSLGVLQTADKCKRKGYGTLITKVFSKILAEEDGNDVFGFIVRENFASQNMFKKLGFKQVTPITWLLNN